MDGGEQPAEAVPVDGTPRFVISGSVPIRVEPLLSGETLAGRPEVRAGAEPSFGRTLRFALAMRGGVSLAVWIGGAVAELDLLRRIRLYDRGEERIAFLLTPGDEPPPPTTLARAADYARLLAAAGYDAVEFDLLAGASAGGLNAVMYAVAQRAGTGLDSVLATWRRVGGLWDLLHPAGLGRVPAFLRGEHYFRTELAKTLDELYSAAGHHPDLVSAHAGVELSATVIDSDDEREADAHEGRGHFHFVGSAANANANQVPSRHDPGGTDKVGDDAAHLARLTLAARSTSSLPAGFEPALISSTDGDGDDCDDDDMRFVFGGHRAQAGWPYRVVDGAVFDNVPIDRALRAARLRPARTRADRTLLFLDPDPDLPLTGEFAWNARSSGFAPAIAGFVTRQLRREIVARESADVQRFNTDRLVDLGRLEVAAPLVRSADWGPSARTERARAYLRQLGTRLAERLIEAISAPSEWQLVTSLPSRRRYWPVERTRLRTLGAAAVARAEEAARDALIEDAAPSGALASPQALADAANGVIAWARFVEEFPLAPGSDRCTSLPEVRERAYAALRAANDALDVATGEVLLASDAFARRSDDDPEAAELARWLDAWGRGCALAELAGHWSGLEQTLPMLREAGRDIARRLGALDAHGGRGPGHYRRSWDESIWSAVTDAAPFHPVELAALLSPSGIPAAVSHIRYWSIGVDQQPSDPSSFTTLVDDEWDRTLQRVVRSSRAADAAERTISDEETLAALAPPGGAGLSVHGKLAGYGFGNFFGFLSSEWRVNDWWWGRLDAAAGLTHLLQSAAHDSAEAAAAAARPVVARVQDDLLEEAYRDPASPFEDASPAGEASPHEPSPRELRTRLRAGSDTVANLSPSYRVALASRGIRVLDRAALRLSGIGGAVVGTITTLLRPVLSALPALADPPRFTLIAAIAAAAAWLTSWTREASGWTPGRAAAAAIAAIAALIVLLALLAIARRTRRAWSQTIGALDGAAAVPAERLSAARRASRAAALRLLVGALFTITSVVPLAIAIARSNAVMTVLCLLVTLGFLAVTSRISTAASRRPIPGRALRADLMYAAFALLGAALPVAQLLWADEVRWLAPLRPWTPAILALCGFAAAVVLTLDWLPVRALWRCRGGSAGVSWLTVSLLAAGAGALAWWCLSLIDGALAAPWQDTVRIGAFLVAWGNVVWWLPMIPRSEWRVPPGLRRAPLRRP